MYLLIFLTAVTIALTAFAKIQFPSTTNAFYYFYIFTARYLIQRPLLIATGLTAMTMAITQVIKTEHDKLLEKAISALRLSVITGVTGLLLSAPVIFTVALVELNLVAVLININPDLVGIRTDTTQIIEGLDKNSHAPEILSFSDKGRERVTSVAAAFSGKDTYYGNRILTAIPDFMIMPINQGNSSMWLVDNTLLLDPTNENDLPAISPILGYKIVQETFPDIKIKLLPKIMMLPKNDYKQLRMDDIRKKFSDLELELTEYGDQAENMNMDIAADQRLASESAEALNQVYRDREAAYQKCLTDKKSETRCKNVITDWDEQVKSALDRNNQSSKTVADDVQLQKDYRDYLKVIEAERSVFKVMESNVDSEYGQFVPPDTIYLTKESVALWSTPDYLETLVHEYLHYASFISDKRVLSDAFFEEGLTEYFARKAIDKTIGEKTNIGYPATVSIIRQMAKRIDDSELSDIYFGKDQAMLEETLDRVYGDHFYRNNRIFFTLLQYTSDQEQMLKYANTVMARIGGSPLSVGDITSSTLK